MGKKQCFISINSIIIIAIGIVNTFIGTISFHALWYHIGFCKGSEDFLALLLHSSAS